MATETIEATKTTETTVTSKISKGLALVEAIVKSNIKIVAWDFDNTASITHSGGRVFANSLEELNNAIKALQLSDDFLLVSRLLDDRGVRQAIVSFASDRHTQVTSDLIVLGGAGMIRAVLNKAATTPIKEIPETFPPTTTALNTPATETNATNAANTANVSTAPTSSQEQKSEQKIEQKQQTEIKSIKKSAKKNTYLDKFYVSGMYPSSENAIRRTHHPRLAPVGCDKSFHIEEVMHYFDITDPTQVLLIDDDFTNNIGNAGFAVGAGHYGIHSQNAEGFDLDSIHILRPFVESLPLSK